MLQIIGLLVLEKKISKGFTINGGHLGNVIWTIYINFVPLSQGGSTLNLALIGQAVSEEIMDDDDDNNDNNGPRSMGIL